MERERGTYGGDTLLRYSAMRASEEEEEEDEEDDEEDGPGCDGCEKTVWGTGTELCMGDVHVCVCMVNVDPRDRKSVV